MIINIPDQNISAFIIGVIAVLAIVAVGALLWFILKAIAWKFPFTRLTLAIALAPMSMISLLDDRNTTALFIYAIVITLAGIIIDGITHVLRPQEPPQADRQSEKEDEHSAESSPSGIVWEKAE